MNQIMLVSAAVIRSYARNYAGKPALNEGMND